MFNSVEVSIKGVVSVGGWYPKAFGVEGVKIGYQLCSHEKIQ